LSDTTLHALTIYYCSYSYFSKQVPVKPVLMMMSLSDQNPDHKGQTHH